MNAIYDIRDERFARLIHRNARLDTLWTGARWCEGPVYVPAGKYVLWSDIPNDRVLRWDEASGAVSTFLSPCLHHNGHVIDREGRVVACEHRGRAVSRIEHDGRRTVLADAYQGKRLNSPNDVVVKSDGSVWFTDPTYGIDSEYEGDKADSEIGRNLVYRVGPDGFPTPVVEDLLQPNGLAFSPDESLLYVADTGWTHDRNRAPRIRVYPVSADGLSAGEGRDLSFCETGLYDGFRVDTAGNIWTSAGDGVHCLAPDGTLLGKILIDEVVANLVFGGPKRNRLFICAATSLRAIYVNAQGVSPHGSAISVP